MDEFCGLMGLCLLSVASGVEGSCASRLRVPTVMGVPVTGHSTHLAHVDQGTLPPLPIAGRVMWSGDWLSTLCALRGS